MYYFAYGSNLSHKQMLARCPDSQPRCRAILPHHRRVFAGWSAKWQGGVAAIKPSQGETVKGAVYAISEADLRSLDKREGYPTVYDRVNVVVTREDGERLEAITYVKHEWSEETQPSQEYLEVIQQGYEDWGIARGRLNLGG